MAEFVFQMIKARNKKTKILLKKALHFFSGFVIICFVAWGISTVGRTNQLECIPTTDFISESS